MSAGDQRRTFLYKLPPSVLWEFCRVMDGLSDLDWTRFASAVLCDQTAVRLAERRERRTDVVMNQWENRNGCVGELVDLLERLQLLRPRDVILDWITSLKASTSPPPPSPPSPPSPPPPPPPPPHPPSPPAKQSEAPSIMSTCRLISTVDEGGGRPLPRPAPPPRSLQSDLHQLPQPLLVAGSGSSGVMCWSYEEVHAGTAGFSPSLQVGEGGFGIVYRASLRNTDCAVKRLKQDCLLDWTLLKESFQTEVDKLSKFRHPNIVDLLGFCEGPGSACLIYSYMEFRSLEDQLHNESGSLSWSQRVSVVSGASAGLQFLHSPPEGHTALIHGDVKSSNILLDRHLVAKLADFGLARFVSRGSSGRSAAQTASVGKTTTVRGTLAYLPTEYVRGGELGTAVDVYSFGVVLLEVLTGRRALEKDRKSGERYLKDLGEEVEDSPTGSCPEMWRKQLDHRLITGGAAEPTGCMEVVALARKCLDQKRKKRPAMTEVYDKLQDIHVIMKKTRSSSSPLHHPPHPHLQSPSLFFPRPPCTLDSSLRALSNQLSKMGPLEDTYQPSQSCQSSSSFCALTPPHPLHSSSLPPSSCSSLPPSSSSSSLGGPCETDESRGSSQYNLRTEFGSNRTSSRSLSLSTRDQYQSPSRPTESQLSQSSIPTEDQYNFLPQPSRISDRSRSGSLPGAPQGSHTKGQTTAELYRVPGCLSPMRSLQPLSPEISVHMNPRKQNIIVPRDTPETPDTPETRETLETPETRETPETWETPDTPETRETPDTPETRETPDTPETRETLVTPETRETPDTPELRETPETRETPDTPETRETPDTPEIRETQETPDTPEIRETLKTLFHDGGRGSVRGPEESDELDYLPAEHH